MSLGASMQIESPRDMIIAAREDNGSWRHPYLLFFDYQNGVADLRLGLGLDLPPRPPVPCIPSGCHQAIGAHAIRDTSDELAWTSRSLTPT